MTEQEVFDKAALTEKSNNLAGQYKLTFYVAPSLTKKQLIVIFERRFGMRPLACNTMVVKPKVHPNRIISRTSYKRGKGHSSSYKKAIFTFDHEVSFASLEKER